MRSRGDVPKVGAGRTWLALVIASIGGFLLGAASVGWWLVVVGVVALLTVAMLLIDSVVEDCVLLDRAQRDDDAP